MARTIAYGDSIADGIARYGGAVGMAYPGRGLQYPPLEQDLARIRPGDTVILSIGWNDCGQAGSAAYGRALAERIDQIQARNGGAPVVLLGLQPLSPGSSYRSNPALSDEHVRRANVQLERAAEAAGAEFMPVTLAPRYRDRDGLHYTPEGARELRRQAESLAPAAAERGSDAVRVVQRALLAQGFNPGTIDGLIGENTMQAWRSWEQQQATAPRSLLDQLANMVGMGPTRVRADGVMDADEIRHLQQLPRPARGDTPGRG